MTQDPTPYLWLVMMYLRRQKPSRRHRRAAYSRDVDQAADVTKRTGNHDHWPLPAGAAVGSAADPSVMKRSNWLLTRYDACVAAGPDMPLEPQDRDERQDRLGEGS